MALCMVEDKGCVWIADIVKRDISMKVRIKRPNCNILSEYLVWTEMIQPTDMSSWDFNGEVTLVR